MTSILRRTPIKRRNSAGASSVSRDEARGDTAAARAHVAPMDERTLTALKGSIEKWRAIEAGTGVDEFYQNCPLCQLFMHEYAPGTDEDDEWAREAAACHGCPVKARTGNAGCEGSPWSEWNQEVDGARTARTPQLVALARAERAFLESLLPTDAAASVATPEPAKHDEAPPNERGAHE